MKANYNIGRSKSRENRSLQQRERVTYSVNDKEVIFNTVVSLGLRSVFHILEISTYYLYLFQLILLHCLIVVPLGQTPAAPKTMYR